MKDFLKIANKFFPAVQDHSAYEPPDAGNTDDYGNRHEDSELVSIDVLFCCFEKLTAFLLKT